MIAILFKRSCFLRLRYYRLLPSIHRMYYSALWMFKILDSTAVDSNDDEDEIDYLSESSGSETDW